MAIIGIFTLAADGKLTGSLKTLTLATKLQFVPETTRARTARPTSGSTWISWRWERLGRKSAGKRAGILVGQARRSRLHRTALC